jgi:hypothetical protein
MDLELSFAIPHSDSTELQALSFELARVIEQTDAQAQPMERVTAVGAKGMDIDWGTILITLIGAQSVLGEIIRSLKPFFERHPEMTVRVTKGNKQIEIVTRDLNPEKINTTIEAVRNLL